MRRTCTRRYLIKWLCDFQGTISKMSDFNQANQSVRLIIDLCDWINCSFSISCSFYLDGRPFLTNTFSDRISGRIIVTVVPLRQIS